MTIKDFFGLELLYILSIKTELCSPTVYKHYYTREKTYTGEKKCTQHCKMKKKSYLLIVNHSPGNTNLNLLVQIKFFYLSYIYI